MASVTVMYRENNNSVLYNIPEYTPCIPAINTSWFLIIIIDLHLKLRSDSVRLEFLRSDAVVVVYQLYDSAVYVHNRTR